MYMKGMEQRPRGAATMYTTTDTSGTHSSSANPTISVDTLENILKPEQDTLENILKPEQDTLEKILKPEQDTLDYILNLIVTDNKIIFLVGLGL